MLFWARYIVPLQMSFFGCRVRHPYSKKWTAKLAIEPLTFYPSETKLAQLSQQKETENFPIPTLAELGFESFDFEYPEKTVTQSLIK